jgi:hypothetical protein
MPSDFLFQVHPGYFKPQSNEQTRTCCNKLLIPWIVVLLEKLTVTQLAKKYRAFYEVPKFYYRVYKTPPLEPLEPIPSLV